MGTFSRDNRTLLYNGNPAKLAGALAGKDDYATTDQLVPPFDDDMVRLSDFNNNFTRHWLIPYWKYSPKTSIDPANCAFARQGDKWNLKSYNADYFARLNQMIDAAARHHIAVQLVLFDRCGLDASKASEAPVQRWPDSPWNSDNNVNGVLRNTELGIPRFYTNPLVRPIQEAWIRYAVGQTKNHWNVFYEVMNEPTSPSLDDRVTWADWVVSIIDNVTRGANLIFYNSFPNVGGQDVALWKERKNLDGYKNYDKFHGVIFHGDPTIVDPTHGGYTFLNDKIFQVCSDGGPDAVRDRFDTNKNWTSWAFSHNMMFQAHSKKTEAARGVGWNSPTPLR